MHKVVDTGNLIDTNKIVKNVTQGIQSAATGLSCFECGQLHAIEEVQSYCNNCRKPLLVTYTFTDIINQDDLASRVQSMWRYHEMLPPVSPQHIITLDEGLTPLLSLDLLSKYFAFSNLWLKDEGTNPTGSFKSRGISMAVSRALDLGIKKVVIPTAGNAGVAISAYRDLAGIEVTVVMPENTPYAYKDQCKYYGIEPVMVDGLIDVCGEVASKIEKETGAFNLATLKEPYRLEGKKTMGYEIAEQMNWKLPDVILYPTGGGTGLIGIWKAFKEMIQLGWIDPDHLPRMIAVQSANCCPVVDHFNGMVKADHYQSSVATGLVVPKPFGLDLIMQVITESNGFAIAVSEDQIKKGKEEFKLHQGFTLCPEGASLWAALKLLVKIDIVSREETIVLLNTAKSGAQ